MSEHLPVLLTIIIVLILIIIVIQVVILITVVIITLIKFVPNFEPILLIPHIFITYYHHLLFIKFPKLIILLIPIHQQQLPLHLLILIDSFHYFLLIVLILIFNYFLINFLNFC